MPPAAYTTITLNTSDATLNALHTITFGGPTPPGLVNLVERGWALQVSDLQRSVLGGRPRYAPVDEPLTITIGGASSTAADVGPTLRSLFKLRDLAHDWTRGLSPVAVRITVQPQGSSTAYTAVVEAITIAPPASALDFLMVGAVQELGLTVRRRAWTGPVETGTVASGYAQPIAVPDLMVLTFPTSVDEAAADVVLGNFGGHIPPGLLLLAPTTAHLPLINAGAASWTGFTGGTPTVVASSGSTGAQGGQYLAIPQPPASTDGKGNTIPGITNGVVIFTTGGALGGLYEVGGESSLAVDVYAVIHATAQSERWRLRPFVQDIGGAVEADQETSVFPSIDPIPVFLGTIRANQSAFNTVRLRVQSVTGEAGAQININYLALRVHALGSQTIHLEREVDLTGSSLSPWSIRAQSNVLTRPQPSVRAVAVSGQLIEQTVASYRGDGYVVSVGDRLAARFLATGKAAWRYNVANLTLSATRYPVYPGLS